MDISGNRRLSDEDILTLSEWAAAGAPEGNRHKNQPRNSPMAGNWVLLIWSLRPPKRSPRPLPVCHRNKGRPLHAGYDCGL